MEDTKTNVKVKLIGENGNAFVILGLVKQAMIKAGVEKSIIKEYMDEATTGDYNNLLMVTMKYVEVS